MELFDIINGQQPPAPQGALPQVNLGGVLENPLSSMMTSPPTTPQEQMQRRQSWSEVLANPNMKSALLRMGLQMMRGTRPGESNIGATARAGLGAMDYYAAKQEIDRRRGMEQQRFDLDKRATESQIRGNEARTNATNLGVQQDSAKFTEWQSQADLRRRTAEEQYQNLIRQGKVDDARLLNEDFKAKEAKARADWMAANPGAVDAARRAEFEQPIAELSQTRAQTAASNATAARATEEVRNSREDRAAMPTWIRTMTDPEAQAYAQAYKDTKTQAQIMEDIRNRLHHGFVDNARGSGSDMLGFQGMAQSIVERYNSDPKGKSAGMSLDQYVADNYNVTLGKSAGTVLALAKQLDSMGGPTASSKVMSEADIAETMKASGKSRAEVLAAARAKGYTVPGK